ADGFLPYETVQLSASDPVLFAPLTLQADNGGSVAAQNVTTSATAPAGVYPLTVRGVESGFVATGMYQVGGISLSPSHAGAGQHPDIAVAGGGFVPNERVQISGGPWGTFYTSADAHGLLQTDQVVSTTSPGRLVVTALGDSGATASATFYMTGASLSVTNAD